MIKRAVLMMLAIGLGVFANASDEPSRAQAVETASNTTSVDSRVRQLKLDVLELNRELFELEEELLFPATTQLSIYVSLDAGAFFKLDSVDLKVDEKHLSKHLYTQRQINALKKGGVQKLFTGNIRPGKHHLVATLQGRDVQDRDVQELVTLEFEKSSTAKYLEIRIRDKKQVRAATFDVVEW